MKRIKLLQGLILALGLLLGCLPLSVFAQETVSGICGENLTWTLENGVLTISGTGTMESYSHSRYQPWFMEKITRIVIEEGVTSIGDHAFDRCDDLVSVTIPDSVIDIAKGTSKKLKATIIPAVVHNSKLTWSSSDETVLKVDSNGNVRGVGVGNAKITCAATDGSGVVAEKKFFVYQPITGLRAEETGNIILFEGKNVTLHTIVSPEDAQTKK